MAIIELKKVGKLYQMGKIQVQAIKNVSFSIEKGEFAALSGPSGSGKSTLLNITGLIDLPTAGNVYINGIDVYEGYDVSNNNIKIPAKLDRKLTNLRRINLGFIFQNFNLIPVLNVFENVELPLKLGKFPTMDNLSKAEKTEWIDYLIETVGLSDWKNHKPSELSGGQRQRVAIARALATKASVILADEPTANLDSKNGDQILSLMQKLNKELSTTFIFSTHDEKIVNMANHVIYIKDGSVINEQRK
ncbi:MAG: ABC transporter ATP-binding protein [Treponema sp.]|nr:ABC transporter ATP-binding protein [Treponema sp.]